MHKIVLKSHCDVSSAPNQDVKSLINKNRNIEWRRKTFLCIIFYKKTIHAHRENQTSNLISGQLPSKFSSNLPKTEPNERRKELKIKKEKEKRGVSE